MNLYFQKQSSESIAIVATAEEFANLAELFSRQDPFVIVAANVPDKVYSEVASALEYSSTGEETPLTIKVIENRIIVRGGKKSAQKIGLNFRSMSREGVNPESHFHLDWFDGTGQLAQQSLGLILQIEQEQH